MVTVGLLWIQASKGSDSLVLFLGDSYAWDHTWWTSTFKTVGISSGVSKDKASYQHMLANRAWLIHTIVSNSIQFQLAHLWWSLHPPLMDSFLFFTEVSGSKGENHHSKVRWRKTYGLLWTSSKVCAWLTSVNLRRCIWGNGSSCRAYVSEFSTHVKLDVVVGNF